MGEGEGKGIYFGVEPGCMCCNHYALKGPVTTPHGAVVTISALSPFFFFASGPVSTEVFRDFTRCSCM